MPGDGLITLAGPRIQEKRRPKRAPFLLGPRLPDGLQMEQILLGELEGTALPREGHDPLKHKSSQMYRYLENVHLVSVAKWQNLEKILLPRSTVEGVAALGCCIYPRMFAASGSRVTV